MGNFFKFLIAFHTSMFLHQACISRSKTFKKVQRKTKKTKPLLLLLCFNITFYTEKEKEQTVRPLTLLPRCWNCSHLGPPDTQPIGSVWQRWPHPSLSSRASWALSFPTLLPKDHTFSYSFASSLPFPNRQMLECYMSLTSATSLFTPSFQVILSPFMG